MNNTGASFSDPNNVRIYTHAGRRYVRCTFCTIYAVEGTPACEHAHPSAPGWYPSLQECVAATSPQVEPVTEGKTAVVPEQSPEPATEATVTPIHSKKKRWL